MFTHLNKIVFCGYREWANNLLDDLTLRFGDVFFHVKTKSELDARYQAQKPELVILAGWSWIVPKQIVESSCVVGLHPSDLPSYAGGSPIQNQILDGINRTKMTLFKLSADLDRGDIIDKVELDLSGNMTKIFDNLRLSSYVTLENFIKNFPNYEATPQTGLTKHVKRLKPDDSRLSIDKIQNMTAENLYDFIRCREDPYPSVYFEDHTGRVYFKSVFFEPTE